MKKVLLMLSASLIVILTGCSSVDKQPLKELVIEETENEFIMEDIDVSKKTLEEIIVFNEKGVTIRREGNNLVLSMPELVLFDFNKYEVKNKVKGSLNALAKALEENPDEVFNMTAYEFYQDRIKAILPPSVSTVFLAKRDTSFVKIRLNLPCKASSIICWKPILLRICVPLIPSS